MQGLANNGEELQIQIQQQMSSLIYIIFMEVGDSWKWSNSSAMNKSEWHYIPFAMI